MTILFFVDIFDNFNDSLIDSLAIIICMHAIICELINITIKNLMIINVLLFNLWRICFLIYENLENIPLCDTTSNIFKNLFNLITAKNYITLLLVFG